jgi:tetratricopeptide (TPR) repeat protein
MRLKLFLTVTLSIFIVSLIISCKRYPQIDYNRRIFPANAEKKEKSSKLDELIKQYRMVGGNQKSYPAVLQKVNQFNYRRYFSKNFTFSPLSEINNLGVEYALKGMYSEAEILFNEVLKEDNSHSSALNNLAIIYELNNNNKAFNMYSRACLLKPDNDFYRLNFLLFCDNKSHVISYE